jgi:hypothetical protein
MPKYPFSFLYFLTLILVTTDSRIGESAVETNTIYLDGAVTNHLTQAVDEAPVTRLRRIVFAVAA